MVHYSKYEILSRCRDSTKKKIYYSTFKVISIIKQGFFFVKNIIRLCCKELLTLKNIGKLYWSSVGFKRGQIRATYVEEVY